MESLGYILLQRPIEALNIIYPNNNLDTIGADIDLDVKELDGVAIMSETDNSKKIAISYYQNIFFSSN